MLRRPKPFENNWRDLMAEIEATGGKVLPEVGSRWKSNINGNSGTVTDTPGRLVKICWDVDGDIQYVPLPTWETYMEPCE